MSVARDEPGSSQVLFANLSSRFFFVSVARDEPGSSQVFSFSIFRLRIAVVAFAVAALCGCRICESCISQFVFSRFRNSFFAFYVSVARDEPGSSQV